MANWTDKLRAAPTIEEGADEMWRLVMEWAGWEVVEHLGNGWMRVSRTADGYTASACIKATMGAVQLEKAIADGG